MSRKFTYIQVKTFFKNNGCELLSPEYKNNSQKLDYICSCGNRYQTRFADFKNGSRCKECRYKRTSQSQKFSFEYIKQFFEDNNCTLLSTEYFGVNRNLKYRCNCGKISEIQFANFKRGARCKFCKGSRISESKKYKYIPYNKAEEITIAAGLNSRSEWKKWFKSIKIDGYPSNPPRAYPAKWKSWGEFLGTGTIATYNRNYRTYSEVKKFAICKKLNSQQEWREYVKTNCLPHDIPHNPYQVYKNEWKSWGVFLGTQNKTPKILSDNELKTMFATKGDIFIRAYFDKNKNKIVEYKCKCGNPQKLRARLDAYFKGFIKCKDCRVKTAGVSSHEKTVYYFLKANKIEFYQEYIFKEFIIARFDFFIPCYNLIIETHGRQHFFHNKRFHKTDKALEVRKKKDEQKRKFAKSKGINYLEIRFDENIYEKLSSTIPKIDNSFKPIINENDLDRLLFESDYFTDNIKFRIYNSDNKSYLVFTYFKNLKRQKTQKTFNTYKEAKDILEDLKHKDEEEILNWFNDNRLKKLIISYQKSANKYKLFLKAYPKEGGKRREYYISQFSHKSTIDNVIDALDVVDNGIIKYLDKTYDILSNSELISLRKKLKENWKYE
ncbi:MAG: hypothetical protein FVQ77_07095 [Cytophagales bacterium]|nr:hypothetical protein [Cytophagales bacterium]